MLEIMMSVFRTEIAQKRAVREDLCDLTFDRCRQIIAGNPRHRQYKIIDAAVQTVQC